MYLPVDQTVSLAGRLDEASAFFMLCIWVPRVPVSARVRGNATRPADSHLDTDDLNRVVPDTQCTACDTGELSVCS